MNNRDSVFPPNANEIRARLSEHTTFIYKDLESWTCDQAAQVVSGIDPYGFNQDDADKFVAISKILNSSAIANTLSSFENSTGTIYLKPHDVIEWANSNKYKLSKYVRNWSKKQSRKQVKSVSSPLTESLKIIHLHNDIDSSSSLLYRPSRADNWFHVINDMATVFFNEYEMLPNDAQAWCQLATVKLKGYEITTGTDRGEDCLNMPGEKSLNKSSFSKRWKSYTDKT